MRTVLHGGSAFVNGRSIKADILVRDGIIEDIGGPFEGDVLVNAQGLTVFPGFVDVHVHFREPGFSYKETIAAGSAAAAAGGYTTVCTMPNLAPAPDNRAHMQQQLDIINQGARCRVVPYGTISMERAGHELSDMEGMAYVAAGYSDDGSGVDSPELMRAAMVKAKGLGKIIAAHCEDKSLIPPGAPVHAGEYASLHGLKGIPSQSEWQPIARDLLLARETGCAYHVCHVSSKVSVELIRAAKAGGVDVTCETAPHYLLLDDTMLEDDGRYKMNPPIRSKADRDALVEAIINGDIDMLATDHAPHSAEEKSGGLAKSAMGIVGLECAFPVMYTCLVRTGRMSLKRLIEVMSLAPSRRFGLGGGLEPGAPADLTAFDLDAEYRIDPDRFLSMGRATPFKGWNVWGKCALTMVGGEIQFSDARSAGR